MLKLFVALSLCFGAIEGFVDPLSELNARLNLSNDVYWQDNNYWREQAWADIEKYRKSDFHVTLTDSDGEALSDATVQFEMTQQGFLFGTAVGVRQGWIDINTAARFQNIISQEFNTIVFENDLKWPQWQTSQSNNDQNHRVTWTNDAISWAQQRNIRVRGHAMLWGSWRWSPNNIPRDPAGLRQAIANHIQDIGSRLNGRLVDWDVLNEPWSENDYTNLLGRQEMAVWFRAARQATSAKLFLNDYPHPGDNNFVNFDAECIRMIVQAGAPLQAFGIQGHVGNSAWNIQQYQNMMNTFANAGANELALTEYDTEISNEQTDANFLRDFMLATFAHQRMREFLVWGFWDPIHWKGRAPFYRQDWSEKPALAVYRQLRQLWRSNEKGTTDREGHVMRRVFQGEYDIHVTVAGETRTFKANVDQDNQVQSFNIVWN